MLDAIDSEQGYNGKTTDHVSGYVVHLAEILRTMKGNPKEKAVTSIIFS